MKTATRPAPAGHDDDCLCVQCMTADMDAALAAQGIDPMRYADAGNGEDSTPQRTRYATPGQRCGRGVVRTVSPRQVRFIRGLMAERDTSGLVRLPGSERIETMSLAGARDLIDRLLACPELPESQRPAAPPASPDQVAYVRGLAAERVHAETIPDTMTGPEASALIDRLRDCPRRPTVALEPGMYERDGVVFKVQRSRSGRLYGKRAEITREAVRDAAGAIVTPAAVAFTYEPGAVRGLTEAHRMTLDAARAFGALYGVCVFGHPLSDEISIAAGIGPKCAERFGVDRVALAALAGVTVRPRGTRRARSAPAAPAVKPAPVAPVAAEPVAAFVSGWGALAALVKLPAPVAQVEPFASGWAALASSARTSVTV